MRKKISLLLSAALLLGLLSACQEADQKPDHSASPSSAAEGWSVGDLAELALEYSGRGDMDSLEAVDAETDREWMAAYIENAYGVEQPWEDAAVIRATGASAFEIAVLRMADSGSAVRAASALMTYLFTRQGDFTGYAPAEADMVANGSIMQDGPYAALFICPAPDGAYAAVEAALSGKSLPAPGQPENSAEPITDVKELRDLLVSECGMDGAELEKLDSSDRGALSVYTMRAYGLGAGDLWRECAIARGTGDSAFEIAVFRVDANTVGDKLNTYLSKREEQFDPDTDNAKLLHQAITIDVTDNGVHYVVMLACPDAEDAAWAFVNAAGCASYWIQHRFWVDSDHPDRCKFTPPDHLDMSVYDTSAIRAAWGKDDPSGLSQYDRGIYDEAQKVLEKVLEDGMSDYEKEVAVYSWVVQEIGYDWSLDNVMEQTPRESFTPYGGLVNHKAVCLGYAATFQLLMDMAGVECITVVGATSKSYSHHAWNMVRLKGEWYCVDATWDLDAGGRQEGWGYFNVTSDYMAATDHQWDYANTPEATAQDHGQG